MVNPNRWCELTQPYQMVNPNPNPTASTRCAGCERCNFVSVSLQHNDCSWYHSCDLTRLQLTPQGFRTYRANVTVVEPPVCFAAGLASAVYTPLPRAAIALSSA